MSSTQHRSVRRRHLSFAGAAVLVLLAGCGGGDGGSAADSSAAASEPAESSAGGSGSEFCTRAAELDQRVDSALADMAGDDPSLKDAFQQLADELRAMDPPGAIASDWEALAGGMEELATAFADFDLTDPDTLAALEAAEKKLTTASDNVETYLRDECGIE
jgi:hypothetical protein